MACQQSSTGKHIPQDYVIRSTIRSPTFDHSKSFTTLNKSILLNPFRESRKSMPDGPILSRPKGDCILVRREIGIYDILSYCQEGLVIRGESYLSLIRALIYQTN